MPARVTRKRARTDADGECLQDTKPDTSANPGTESAHEADVLNLGQGGKLKKDEEFWFHDGTVVLHAGDVELRVYRGLLESHSTVLAELFAQPHSKRHISADGQHSVPCPVIKLSDSAHDLRDVLRCYMPRHSRRYLQHTRDFAFILTSSAASSPPSPLLSTRFLQRSGWDKNTNLTTCIAKA